MLLCSASDNVGPSALGSHIRDKAGLVVRSGAAVEKQAGEE